jgi:hypothetical protein
VFVYPINSNLGIVAAVSDSWMFIAWCKCLYIVSLSVMSTSLEQAKLLPSSNKVDEANWLRPNALYFIMLLCLTPDDFTRKWESTGAQWVNSIDILYKLDSASLLVKLKPRIFQRLPHLNRWRPCWSFPLAIINA